MQDFNSIDLKWKHAGKHILAWGIFIIYELVFMYLMTGTLTNPGAYILNYILNISLFYFNAHVLLAYSTQQSKNKLLFSISLIITEIVLFVIIKYPINLVVLGEKLNMLSQAEFYQYAVSNTMRSFYFVGFSTAYWFALEALKRSKEIGDLQSVRLLEQNEKILLQKDLLQSKNAYLQAQVNPHLLFNTLNFMYNASAKVSEKLAETVMNLSDMMRYALTRIDEDDQVQLEKELEHIHTYIRLNQARFEEKLNIEFHIDGNPDGYRIIPLALITLIENMFKYGDLRDAENPAHIRIRLAAGRLTMVLRNKKRAGTTVAGHGTGIRNLRERLHIHYPDACSLDISNGEDCYELILSINLNSEL